MGKIILVTGGCGFIGVNLCNELVKREPDSEIIAVDNMLCPSPMSMDPRVEVMQLDITNCNFCSIMSSHRVNEIYHLASIASPKWYKRYPIKTIMTNIVGTETMCYIAQLHNAKLLLSSTSEIYGNPKIHPQTENYFGHRNSVGPRSCYDCSKATAETIVYEYQNNGLNATIVRIFNTFGPGMRPDDGRVVSEFITRVLDNKSIVLFNKGEQTRSFCYIDDMVEYLIRAMACCHRGPINVGNNSEFTIFELSNIIERLLNTKIKRVFSSTPADIDDPQRRKPDLRLAQNILQYTPSTPFFNGLINTIEYFNGLH